MMKLKKIGAITLAIMLIAMVVTVWAEDVGNVDGELTNGKDGMLYTASNEGAIDQNTLTFKKELVLFNTTEAEVHHPIISYRYSIASVETSGKTITDGDDDQGVVYPGPTGSATITTPITFSGSDSETAVTPNGKIASQDVTVTIDPSKFVHAGIYRYLITESNTNEDSSARTAAGVSRGTNYANTRYLDVYVRRKVATDPESVTTNYVVYGYVLFKGTDASISKTETEVTKSQGFVATETSSGVYGTTDVDYYETFNLKVEKDIEGTLAETSHQFPFSVAFTSPITTTAVIEWAKGTATTAEASFTVAEGASSATLTLGDATTTGYNSSDIKLADTEYVTFYGLPARTTAVVSEINDTYDIYSTRHKIDSGEWSNPAVNIAANAVTASIYSVSAVGNGTTLTSNSETDTEIKVENNIEIVSPTGYVSRFAPYALILIGGIALLVVAKKHKKHPDEE